MRATLVRCTIAATVLTTALGGGAANASTTPAACGPEWSKVSTPNPGTIYSVLLDVATISRDDAWSVGFRAYIDDDGLYAVSPIIERWDGDEWTVAYRPRSHGQLAGIFAVASDDVWAVGHSGLESPDYQPLIMHWDGGQWTRVRSPQAEMGYLTAIGGTGPDDLWAAGTLIGTYDTIVEHWNGTRWKLVAHPSPSSDYVALGGLAAGAPDDVTIVGTYLDDQGRNAPLALRWNGTTWRRAHPQTVGELGTSLFDVTVTSDGRYWAVGSYVTESGDSQALAQRSPGRRWTVALPPPLPGASSYASVTSGPDGVWAVGSHTGPGDPAATLTAQWRPRSDEWRVIDSPNANGDSYLLGVDQSAAGEFWAVGFHRPGDTERTLAMQRCG